MMEKNSVILNLVNYNYYHLSNSYVLYFIMSHDTGITQHYFKLKQEELLEEYLKVINLLTINNKQKILEKQIMGAERKKS
jgi:hypothetical protein